MHGRGQYGGNWGHFKGDRMCWRIASRVYICLSPKNLWLCPWFGKKISEDVIKVMISRWSHPGLLNRPKSNDKCPWKRQKRQRYPEMKVLRRRRQRLEGWVQAKPPEAGGGEDTLPELPEGTQPCTHLDFGLVASRTVREWIYVGWGHLACGYSGSYRHRSR